jgi:hypothetical protein
MAANCLWDHLARERREMAATLKSVERDVARFDARIVWG